MLNGRLVFSRSPNDSKVFVVRLWNSKSGQVSLLWIMTVNGADSLSYLTQITKLQSHSAVSGLLAFCKIPRPNFNSGRRFCASGKKRKRNHRETLPRVQISVLSLRMGRSSVFYCFILLLHLHVIHCKSLKTVTNRGNYDKRSAEKQEYF